MKRFKISMLAAVLIASMTASPVAYAKDKVIEVGAAVYGLKGEFMRLWSNALKEHPLVKSGKVNVTVYDGNYDALTQSNQFETMITQKVDGILFVPIDVQAGAEPVASAVDANIPVVSSNARVNSDKITSYVGSLDVIAGQMEAQAALNAIEGKGNVVILQGPIGQSGEVERSKGIEKVLANYPNVKVLEKKTANWSRAEALSLMENWLTAHPGKISAVIAENDDMAVGAIQAMKNHGIDPKTIPTVGVDGIKDAINAVKSGDMVLSVLQDAQAQAQGSLDVLLRKIIGSSYKPVSPIWEKYKQQGLEWKDGTAKQYDIPWTPITKENVEAFIK